MTTPIVTITMNPAIDLSTSIDRVEPTRKMRCATMRRDPGGGGINAARVIRRLGADVTAVFPSGGMLGKLLQHLVEAEGIASIAIPVTGETRENFTALEKASGEQYRFVLPGPQLKESEWQQCAEAIAGLELTTGFLLASGSLPRGVPDDFYARLLMRIASTGAKLVLDTSRRALKATLEKGVYLVKPNLGELQELFNAPLEQEAVRVKACRDLIAAGGAEIVALTLGEDGAILVTREDAWRSPPLPVRSVSAVGAGDSFLGAMVFALSRGQNLEDAFRYAMAAGSAALLSPGTELALRADIDRLLDDVKIERIG